MLSAVFTEPANDADRSGDTMPCVIYMHGNAGNKMEGMYYAQSLLPHGINLCCFDFSGCGNSEGQFVTLGHKEKDDLKSVIEYLYEHKRVSVIGLWGRSMGAATSIFFLKENPGTVNCMVLDSGFSQLTTLIGGMAGQMGIPPEFVEMLTPMLDMQVYNMCGFHLADLDVEAASKHCEVPAYFLHGSDDNFVVPDHSIKNHAAYKGTVKSMKQFPGDHNAERPPTAILEIAQFFKQHLN